MPVCPVCLGTNFSTLIGAADLEAECKLRERFIKHRLQRPASNQELKDLTDFFHAEKADILACSNCLLLIRKQLEPPPARAYSEDEYDPAVIERLYPEYLEAFRKKATPFRTLLPAGARVVEIGSHYGAFLQTAQEWGWQGEGVDIGKDTSRFAQSKGFKVHVCDITGCKFAEGLFDGVFVWNCFEQLDDPKPLLREARRILKPGGLLVVRTPNGLFYQICQASLKDPNLDSGARDFLVDALGYNNLLGFPYLYGHRAGTLEQLIEPFGFGREGFLNSELLTLPLPDEPKWVENEERAINTEMRMIARSMLSDREGVLTGPWIELWFRATASRAA